MKVIRLFFITRTHCRVPCSVKPETTSKLTTHTLALATTAGLKETVCCAEIAVGYSHLREMTNSIIEISEVGVQLPEWRITLHLYTYGSMNRYGEIAAHPSF